MDNEPGEEPALSARQYLQLRVSQYGLDLDELDRLIARLEAAQGPEASRYAERWRMRRAELLDAATPPIQPFLLRERAESIATFLRLADAERELADRASQPVKKREWLPADTRERQRMADGAWSYGTRDFCALQRALHWGLALDEWDDRTEEARERGDHDEVERMEKERTRLLDFFDHDANGYRARDLARMMAAWLREARDGEALEKARPLIERQQLGANKTPVRIWLEAHLQQHPRCSASEAWQAIQADPPDGVRVRAQTIEYPGGDLQRRRFDNLLSDVRKALGVGRQQRKS